MIGQLIFNRYQIISQLGGGGFSVTYLAEDIQRPGKPPCVVKQLIPPSNDPQLLQTARRLFNEEAKVLEKLGKHPQIPTLLAYGEKNQEFFLVQEYIPTVGQILFL